jgi:Domain of unknown function (DUF4430)
LPARGRISLATLLTVLLAGCGFGAGESSEGTATLVVTRDYGAERLLAASEEDPPESETVLRLLDREAEVTTRYGGGFVQSIEGLAGGIESGRSLDWFFYVNGIESPIGSADRVVRGGDRIWWDYHDWTDVMRVPAVVGSFPEPFLQEAEGSDRAPVEVVCAGARPPCDEVADRLAEEGVNATIERPAAGEGAPGGDEALRLLVGPWGRVRLDPAAAGIERGPAGSGVFARFERRGDAWRLLALDPRGREADPLRGDAGLVAAVRPGEAPPVWVVTGTGPGGVGAAAALLNEDALRDRYALAVAGGTPVPLPVAAGGG